MNDSIAGLLEQVPFLAPLNLAQRTALAAEAILHEYAPGSDIVREGSPGESLFIIESGSAVIYTARSGAVIEMWHSGPGQFFGEMATLEGAPRSASVRAETAVRVLEISRAGFQRLLRESPDIALAVMGELSANRKSQIANREELQGLWYGSLLHDVRRPLTADR